MSMNTEIYQDISTRTAGDIYIGVVGPVRAGKSTFIKRFMETQVIPNIDNVYRRERAKDELPQSGSGRMVMTAEPKFVPEEAVDIALDEGSSCSVRLIDCVGYMIPGATGQMEGESPRMVSTPWLDHEVTMSEAAELGTTRVIREHSTIGVVVTTDGSITDIPREDYIEAEGRVIRELQEVGKPFLVLLNATEPESDRVQAMARDIASRYGVTCLPVNCLTLDDNAVGMILKAILYEFPLCELDLFIPPWVEALADDHPIKSGLYQAIRENTGSLHCIREVQGAISAIGGCESVSSARITSIQLGTGVAAAELQLPRALFYRTLSEQSGFDVKDDGGLLSLLRFERGHLVVECAHLLAAGGGKRCDPLVEQRFLRRFVLCGLVKGGDIAREALAEVVDEAHARHLVHVGLGKFIAQEKHHQCDAPAVLGNALVPPAGGVAVAGGVLQFFRRVQRGEQFAWSHASPPLSFSGILPEAGTTCKEKKEERFPFPAAYDIMNARKFGAR